ncbi:hypothetical protein BD310DRAFT_821590, partial [Dichomitus squalens]
LSTCPLTIHALLHIADSIRDIGPVWAAWAFPMERYCGSLQPAIRSRRFPYASLNRYVLDKARLDHIKLRYGSTLRTHLTLHAPLGVLPKSVEGYTSLVLLPSSRTVVLDRGTQTKIIGALCTRFTTAAPSIIRQALPTEVEEWAKFRILNDGDTIRSAALDAVAADSRNASYVRYELFIDLLARQRNAPSIFRPQVFYGELQHIYLVNLSPIPSCGINTVTPILLAAIKTCNIDRTDSTLDIHWYTSLGAVDFVDLETIQAVVGRVKDRGHFAIIDRNTVNLVSTHYIDEPEGPEEVVPR